MGTYRRPRAPRGPHEAWHSGAALGERGKGVGGSEEAEGDQSGHGSWEHVAAWHALVGVWACRPHGDSWTASRRTDTTEAPGGYRSHVPAPRQHTVILGKRPSSPYGEESMRLLERTKKGDLGSGQRGSGR